jgi:hypothetical protein
VLVATQGTFVKASQQVSKFPRLPFSQVTLELSVKY